MKYLIALPALTLAVSFGVVAEPALPAIVPRPAKLEQQAGVFTLQPDTRIAFSEA